MLCLCKMLLQEMFEMLIRRYIQYIHLQKKNMATYLLKANLMMQASSSCREGHLATDLYKYSCCCYWRGLN